LTDAYSPIRRIFEETDKKIEDTRWIATAIVLEVRKEDRKIRVAILPDLIESNWIRVYYLNAGDNYLSGPLPEIDTEVVCLFIGGNPNACFVLAGGFLQDVDKPEDIEDDFTFPIQDKYGNKIVMSSKGIVITSKLVQIGDKDLSDNDNVARKSDLDALISEFNSHKLLMKSHYHIGNMGAPTILDPTIASQIVDTDKSVCSKTVKAKD